MSVRTWGLGSLVSLAIVASWTSGGQAQLPRAATKPIALVDGTAITLAEVEAALKQTGPTATPLTEAQKRQMQMEAVGMLVDDLLMQQFLRKHGPKVDPAEVNKRLAELEDQLKKQNKTLADFFKETGQSETQLRTNILNMLQWAEYVKQHLTEADLKHYYEESKDFFDRVGVRASHIVIRISPGAPDAERQAIRVKLAALRQEIVGGKIDFAEAAKKYSQCTSAPTGGDIGYFPRKLAVDEAFARAAFALKVGEVSDVVQTEYGMHLIKVTDRKAGQASDYTKIKDEVRELYVEEMRMALLNQERKTAHVEINLP
jgi:parvulin-like peptidyl-prolyl isomerase